MILLGFAGRKGSGKSTLTQFLLRNASVLFGDPNIAPRWKTSRHVTYVKDNRLAQPVMGVARAYALADPFKRFCVEVMGLSEAQCYGTDAEKNTLTRYEWERMPHYADIEAAVYNRNVDRFGLSNGLWPDNTEKAPSGPMTARQVMQEVGTGIGRCMNENIWVEACLRQIQKDNAELAVVDDVRFPNEVDAIKAAGGKVIRLHRAPYREDEHASETTLDFYETFDAHILSRHDTPWKACSELLRHLQGFGIVWPEEMPEAANKLIGPDGRPMYGSHRGDTQAA